MRILIALFIFFASAYLLGQSSADSLHNKLTQLAERGVVPGFGVAIVDAKGILFAEGYGFADKEARQPYTASTLQNIASISKTFIGIALAQAVEKGFLRWNDPINKYLDYNVTHPRFPRQRILIRHLANHTSGINDSKMYDYSYYMTDGTDYQKEDLPNREYREIEKTIPNQAWPLGDFCREFLLPEGQFYHRTNWAKFAPGENFAYSNVGAGLAAHVLEKATGQLFDSWTRQYIFSPLGMEHTAWSFDSTDSTQHAQLYFASGAAIPRYGLNTYPDGGLLTSVHDLGLYLSAAIRGYESGNEILSQAGYRSIIPDYTILKADEETYGYCWQATGAGVIGHTGHNPGVITFMHFEAETSTGQLVFFNGFPSKGKIIMEVYQTVLDARRKWQE